MMDRRTLIVIAALGIVLAGFAIAAAMPPGVRHETHSGDPAAMARCEEFQAEYEAAHPGEVVPVFTGPCGEDGALGDWTETVRSPISAGRVAVVVGAVVVALLLIGFTTPRAESA